MKKGHLFGALFAVSIVAFIVWAGIRTKCYFEFQDKVDGYLDNYVRAGSVELAEKNLDAAIKGAEEMGLTEGQISVLCHNPKNNIGVWYQNLVKCRADLREVAKQPMNERSRILQKQKQALSGEDNGSEGSISIKVPDGITIYPYNRFFFWLGVISGIACLAFGITLLVLKSMYALDEPVFKVKLKSVA